MASILKVDQIQTASGGTPTAADLGINTTGNVLQVVNKTFTGTYSSTVHNTWTDFGLNLDVVPKASNSNWLITGMVHHAAYTTNPDWSVHLRAYIGSNSAGSLGDSTGNSRPQVHVQGLDPANDAAAEVYYLEVYDSTTSLSAGVTTNFSIRAYHGRDSGLWYVNRGYAVYDDDISGSNPISSMTIYEIAG